MIQYPNNVKPQNQAFDATAGTMYVKFTFNGDYLSGICTRITDYDTGSLVRETWYQDTDRLPLAYNGDEVQNSISNPNLVNGGRYVFQMMLVQRTSDGLSPICDMPVIGDKVLQNASNTNTIYIAKGITAIYPWGKNGDVYTPKTVVEGQSYFNPMEIKIGNVTRTIVSYTDNVEVDGQIYGQLVLDGNVSANAGDYFRIYSNSVITPQYFFKCNSAPVMVSPSHVPTGGDQLRVNWNYTQAEGVPMKYYILRLWWSNNENFVESSSTGSKVRLIEETNRIYSQLVSYNFKSPYYHDYSASDPDTTDYYKIEIIGLTQDEMQFSDEEVFYIEPHDYRGTSVDFRQLYDFYVTQDPEMGCTVQHLRGYMTGSNEHYELFRKNIRTGEDELVGWTKLRYEAAGVLAGNDLSASLRGNYEYTLVLFASDGGAVIPNPAPEYEGTIFPTSGVQLSGSAYYITALNEAVGTSSLVHQDDIAKRKTYRLGDTWKFAGEIANTTVTNNLDTMVHVGYGQYISTTSTEVNYMSGVLSAMIGYVDCVNHKYIDDIDLVKAWRKFITQKVPFLLKSQKGDVWVVNVSENPTTEYDETVSSIPTTISFAWAECDSIDNIILKDIAQ